MVGTSGAILVTSTSGYGPAPVTAVSGADSGWHNRPVGLVFTAVDEPGGAGMIGGQAKTAYTIDNGAWITATTLTIPAPIYHSGDGVHMVSYRSTDAAGNVEAAKTVTVKIDT